MRKVILLSDLWGRERWGWVTHYTSLLEKHFQLICYDCQELGGISGQGLSEEELHAQFVNGGIDRAVERLLEAEKEAYAVLGFSVGGYIAWKAIQKGFKAEKLIGLSSTRLRKETEKPGLKIDLYYGEEDKFRPEGSWFEQLEIQGKILPNQGHEMYVKKEVAEEVCEGMIFDELGVQDTVI